MEQNMKEFVITYRDEFIISLKAKYSGGILGCL